MATIPPLPPGYTLDPQPNAAPPAAAAPASAGPTIPPLPPGYTLDDQPAQKGPSAIREALMAPVGGAELLAQTVTGAVASIPAAVAYGGAAVGKAAGAEVDPAAVQNRVQNYFTYQPQSDSAKAGGALVNRIAAPVVEPIVRGYGQATDAVARASPFAGEMMRAAPSALQAAGSVVPGVQAARGAVSTAARAPIANGAPSALQATRNVVAPVTPQPVAPPKPGTPATTAEEVLRRQAASSQTNMGAAAAMPDLRGVSPELRASIVETARRTGGAVNPEALQRQIDADRVGVRLTDGQATNNPRLISEEQNMRGRVNGVAEGFDAQNRALGQRMQTLRDEAGPDVFSANVVEHGDTLIGGYRAVDEARQTQITAAYDALRQAAGGNFPIGARTLLQDVSQRLHGQLITDHAPRSIMNALEGFAAKPGSMTFENFEAMRTNLATIQRTATDGLERRAAGLIRQAMEDLPLAPGAARLKPLADEARRLARERFAAIEADPAYDAAINETVPPDRFVQKFLVGGTRDNVARMAAAIGGDEAIRQTMGVAALDYLRDQARLSPGYEGNFAAASFSKALNKLSPSLRSMLPPAVVEQLETLGRVAGYTTAQPRGSFVNNSNTFVSAAADSAKSTAEGVANVAAGGVPLGTWVRRGMEGASQRRQASRMFEPGAGLGRLPERNGPP